MICTRTYAAHIEGTYAVGASHIELLAVRCADGIAVGPDKTGTDVTDELTVVAHGPCLAEVGLYLEELRIRILEHLLGFLVPLLAGCHISQRQEIGSLAHYHLPVDRTTIG